MSVMFIFPSFLLGNFNCFKNIAKGLQYYFFGITMQSTSFFYHNILRIPMYVYGDKISKKGISRPGWTIKDNEIKKVKKKYKAIKIDGKSGSLCFMHGNLVHSSTPNKSKTKDRATDSMAFLNKNAKFRGKGFNSVKVKYKLN